MRVSGNAPYTMTDYNENLIALGSVFEDRVSFRALQAGTTPMIITDSTNRQIQMNIEITKDLELDEQELTIEQGQSGYLHIVKGNGRYGIEKDNNLVNIYRTNDEVFEVEANELGETIIKITDSEGGATSARITVVEVGAGDQQDNQTKFESLFLLNQVEDADLENIVAFNVTGDYDEVGIEFQDNDGEYVRQTLNINEDGFYIIQPDTTICTSCIQEFKPYIRDRQGNYIYAQSGYLSFGGNENFRNVAIENGGTNVANSEDINISSTHNSFWYHVNQTNQDIAVGVMLAYISIAGGAIGLDISEYMLNQFMYGNGVEEIYGNTHWITEEVKLTSWYNDRKDEALLQESNYSNIGISESYKIDELSYYHGTEGNTHMYYIGDELDSGRQGDFAYSVGKITNWTSSVVNYEGDFYFKMLIEDKYDFAPTDGTSLKDIFNAWGHHYQERGHGIPYSWDIEILEKLD